MVALSDRAIAPVPPSPDTSPTLKSQRAPSPGSPVVGFLREGSPQRCTGLPGLKLRSQTKDPELLRYKSFHRCAPVPNDSSMVPQVYSPIDEQYQDEDELCALCPSKCCKCDAWGKIQGCMQGAVPPKDGSRPLRHAAFDPGDLWGLRCNDQNEIVGPYTQELVIVTRHGLPPHLFHRVQFANPDQYGRLVTEAEYTKRTDVINYDLESQQNDEDMTENGYVRLITLNWWYYQLLLTLCLATISVSNLFSNVIFSINLFTESSVRLTVPLPTRIVFVILFVSAELMIARKCLLEVKQEWERKSDTTKVGDLIAEPEINYIDKIITWVAMFVFKFIHVDAIVKDIVIWLHPWKSVQPYGSFKVDGHRCFFVGWASPHMYRVENKQGQEELLPHHVFLIAIITTFKINVAIESGSCLPLVLVFPSLINLVVIGVKLSHLVNDRKQHWNWLCYQHEMHKDTGSEEQLKAIDKQKTQHFPTQPWGTSLDERCQFAVRSIMAVVVPAILGVLMHCYDSFQPMELVVSSTILGCSNHSVTVVPN